MDHTATERVGQAAPRQQAKRAEKTVGHFRQILLWPVHLLARTNGQSVEDHAAELCAPGPNNPWTEVSDEFGDPHDFCERHYHEFVNFLPPVQRFLYGQGLGRAVRQTFGESPIRVMRRSDIAKVRVTMKPGDAARLYQVAHIDLYFFFDVDVAMLAVEIAADNLPLPEAQEMLFQFGRVYPAFWQADGRADHCPALVEWMASDDTVLSTSDYASRSKYLAFVCQHRAPPLAAHWEYVMRPLVLHHADTRGNLRYRQLEDNRMPQMAYLAMSGDATLTRADDIRLAFASGSGDSASLPFAERHLTAFEEKHCYDRYDEARDGVAPLAVRYMSCGTAFVVTGADSHPFFVDAERGYLGRFRHQHFLTFLIAHFHKSALSMFSDRLAAAVNKLDVTDATTVNAFRAATRNALEKFLRFTHRYWFHTVSNDELTKALFELNRRHLDLDSLFEDIRQEVQEMSQYLENEAMRRQNDTVVRLTVVTILGLIGTIATGFLGMNIFALADEPAWARMAIFAAILIPTIALTLLTVVKSRRLSDFLDALSDDNLDLRAKLKAFREIWWRPKPSQ